VRERTPIPLILENFTAPVVVPGAEMDVAEFAAAVLDRTGCDLLCDVTNLRPTRSTMTWTWIASWIVGRGTGWCSSTSRAGTGTRVR
jgi:hypothetical protein